MAYLRVTPVTSLKWEMSILGEFFFISSNLALSASSAWSMEDQLFIHLDENVIAQQQGHDLLGARAVEFERGQHVLERGNREAGLEERRFDLLF